MTVDNELVPLLREGIDIIKIITYKIIKDHFSKDFIEIKPAVELVGNGVILPSTDGLMFPFRAVNLRAVDVKIIQVYENNILQFLQTNQLNGNREKFSEVILPASINDALFERFSPKVSHD